LTQAARADWLGIGCQPPQRTSAYRHIIHERMFTPIAPRFVLVDTEGWLWIRTAGAPRDGDPDDGELHQSTGEGAMFAAT